MFGSSATETSCIVFGQRCIGILRMWTRCYVTWRSVGREQMANMIEVFCRTAQNWNVPRDARAEEGCTGLMMGIWAQGRLTLEFRYEHNGERESGTPKMAFFLVQWSRRFDGLHHGRGHCF